MTFFLLDLMKKRKLMFNLNKVCLFIIVVKMKELGIVQ